MASKRSGSHYKHIVALNTDVLYKIYSYLSSFDVMQAAKVCRLWRSSARGVRYLTFSSLRTTLDVRAMEQGLQWFPKVVHLDLSTCINASTLLRESRYFAQRLPAIVSLSLRCCVMGRSLETCGRMENLQRLDVAEVSTFTAAVLTQIATTSTALTQLDLCRTAPLTDEFINAIARCLRLKVLKLDSGAEILASTPIVSLRPLAVLTRLAQVHFARVPVPDAMLAGVLKGWTRLQRLYLYRCLRVGSQSLEVLSIRCTSLEKLAVWDAPELNEECLQRFVQTRSSLVSLRLYDCPVSQAFINAIKATHKYIHVKGEGGKKRS